MGKPKKKHKKTGGDHKKSLKAGTLAKIHRLVDEVRDLEQSKAALVETWERFRDQDQPAFDKWIKKNLGDERRTLEEALNEASILSEALQGARFGMAMGTYDDFAEAFDDLVASAREEAKAEAAFADSEEAEEDDLPPPPPGEMPEEMVDELLEEYLMAARGIDAFDLSEAEYEKCRAQFKESFQHMADGNKGAFEKAMQRIGADESAGNQSAVKVAYRRLAKRLHPDAVGAELSEAEKALWNEVMACYQALDAEGLEFLDIRLSLLRGEDIDPSQAPALRKYRDELSDQIEDLSLNVEEAVMHPAWEFSLKKKTKAFLEKMRRDLSEAIAEAEERLFVLRQAIDNVKRAAPGRKKAPRKKKKPKPKPMARKKSAPPKSPPPSGPTRQTEFGF